MKQNRYLKKVRTFLANMRGLTWRERAQYTKKRLISRSRYKHWRSLSGERYVETELQEGFRMRLPPSSLTSLCMYCEEYEMNERIFLKNFLRPGDTFVDVGAHVGLFTVLAGHYVGATGRVYAFEPCSETYRRLLENVELNGLANVFCRRTAMSNRRGRVELTMSLDGYDGCNSLARPFLGNHFGAESVDSIAWDEFAGEQGLAGRVAMMKIDVEGWETQSLDGGARTLSRDDAPILQVEFCDRAAATSGSSCRELYRALESLGYKMFIYDAKNRTIVPDPLRDSYWVVNLIAAKRPDYVMARLRGGEL
jgi:FkbM family methyltransferase